jgi:fatty-acyl-CoA synthase
MFVPLTPLRCVQRAVDVFGSKTGVVSGASQFTYAQFGERAERLASGLTKLGIEAGDRVAYLSFNNHQLLEGYFGVVQARAIVLPLNVRLAEGELAAILEHSGARMVIFETDFAPLADRLRKLLPGVERWVSIDEKVGPADLVYEEIVDQGHAERADIFSYDEMSIAELFYTSGSTGVPKGVMLSHRTLYMHALSVAMQCGRPETIVDLHTIPLFHANGWGRPQASTLLGSKQVMVRRFEPAAVFQLIEEHKATDMSLVPTMANALLNALETPAFRGKYDLSSLRRMMTGGAASSPELVERWEKAFPGCECVAGYGLTETSPVVTTALWKGLSYGSDKERWRRQAMTGWAVPGAEVRVVDAGMRDVPRDGTTIGEIVIQGDQVMDGYFHDPEATAAAMSGAPLGKWLHTGDMAVWDEESYVNIVDRKKEIIISGGENISSIEVEAAVNAHPGVAECAVVAAPDETWGEVPAVIVVRKPGAALDEPELKEFLRNRLSRFKLPRIIEFRDEPLPKTGTGKIRKMMLKEKFWSGKDKRVQG